MNENKKSIKIIYLLVFLMFLAVFTVARFPKLELKNSIISVIETKSPRTIVIGDLSFDFPSDVDFKKVNIVLNNDKRVEIDSLRLSPSFFSYLLSESVKIPFTAKLYDGKIEGDIYYSKEDKSVESFTADISSIDSSNLPALLSGNSKLDLNGNIDGYIKYGVDESKNRKDPKVFYSFTSNNLAIKNFEIDKFVFSEEYRDLQLDLRGSIDERLTTIQNLSFENKDFDLSFAGKMPPPWRFKKGGRLDLGMNLTLYSNKAKLALLKAFLSPNTDGSHSGRILGTTSNPRLVTGKKKSPSGV